VIPKFVRKKFAGVQHPLGRWILRHICEFIVLSPAILVTWIWLKVHRKEILIVGRFSNTISMFILPLEPELRRRKLEMGQLDRTIVLYLSDDANSQIRNMYDRVAKIYGSERKIRRRIIWWASLKFVYRRELFDDQSDPMWVEGRPVLAFTEDEENRGKQFLDSNGLKPNEFICYTVRSESYYLARIAEVQVIKPQTFRNPSEDVYLKVAESLITDGFKVLRMGKDLNRKLDKGVYPKILDYAIQSRTDFLDIYLLKNCKFLLNGATGLISPRWIWNLPSVTCDSYLIWRNQLCYDIFLLQRVWLKQENRLATFTEMLSLHGYSDEKHQARLGVELVKNTVEEIRAACDEMNARIDGTWVTTKEDEDLQFQYQELIVKFSNQPTWNGRGRIGAKFLRDNQDLLR
jgi:putative glycosyltransferase (TIGR04372 family)